MHMKKLLLTMLFLSVFFPVCFAQKQTFTNPLLPSGADPYSF
ncbi:MAG: glycosyl hydrolase family 43, partial [Sphingobacteriaceae bacterium]